MTFTDEELAMLKQHTTRLGPNEKFLTLLDRACEFHRTNPNDNYGISNAVICTLTEVREAFAESHGLPMLKREATK